MNRILLLSLLFLIFHAGAQAQTQQAIKAKADTPSLPATVEITAKADVDLVTKARLELDNAQLKARNFELEVQQQLEAAKKQLAELQAKAADKQRDWQVMMGAMTKLPTDKLGDYQMTLDEKGGKWILTRKASQ